MRCARCQRPLTESAVPPISVWYGYGPKCARLAGLLEKLPRARKVSPSPATAADERQLALELEAS